MVKQEAPAAKLNEADIDLFSGPIDSITNLDTHSTKLEAKPVQSPLPVVEHPVEQPVKVSEKVVVK